MMLWYFTPRLIEHNFKQTVPPFTLTHFWFRELSHPLATIITPALRQLNRTDNCFYICTSYYDLHDFFTYSPAIFCVEHCMFNVRAVGWHIFVARHCHMHILCIVIHHYVNLYKKWLRINLRLSVVILPNIFLSYKLFFCHWQFIYVACNNR